MSGEPQIVARPRARRTMQAYGTVVVVGGGCYGTYYLRQLRRAIAAGALSVERIIIVDRDPACQAAALVEGTVEVLAIAEWASFFDAYLSSADAVSRDAIVPSPLMPHLMSDWLVRRARERWPGRSIAIRPLDRPPSIPWQRAAPDGTHYVSFAEWTCPVNCIEPARCPATRGLRTWSMPPAIRAYVDAERSRGRRVAGPLLFHCEHRAYGVGMFDTSAVVDADRQLAEGARDGAIDVLVGTVSHCHGALSMVAIGS